MDTNVRRVADAAAVIENFSEKIEVPRLKAYGCFRAGAFGAWWSLIESSPPVPLPPTKNQWVTSYEATYR